MRLNAFESNIETVPFFRLSKIYLNGVSIKDAVVRATNILGRQKGAHFGEAALLTRCSLTISNGPFKSLLIYKSIVFVCARPAGVYIYTQRPDIVSECQNISSSVI